MAKDQRHGHDQNFKNLILDYPRKALEVFCPQEAKALDQENVRIVPLRQEQLKERLGDRFRELDVPLLAEWPDGRREALLFVLEEESDPRRFSIHCLDLAELCGTQRVVPVVIFLRSSGNEQEVLTLGGDHHQYLNFRYIRCALPEWEAETWWDSNNLVARLLLSVMHWRDDQKLEVYARSVRGLTMLEPDPEKQLKYIDFIDIYSALDDNEMEQYKARYPQENQTMTSLSERLRAEGMVKGMAEGMEQGERAVLTRLIERRFGPLTLEIRSRLENADQQQLESWADRILDADSLEQMFQDH